MHFEVLFPALALALALALDLAIFSSEAGSQFLLRPLIISRSVIESKDISQN